MIEICKKYSGKISENTETGYMVHGVSLVIASYFAWLCIRRITVVILHITFLEREVVVELRNQQKEGSRI